MKGKKGTREEPFFPHPSIVCAVSGLSDGERSYKKMRVKGKGDILPLRRTRPVVPEHALGWVSRRILSSHWGFGEIDNKVELKILKKKSDEN